MPTFVDRLADTLCDGEPACDNVPEEHGMQRYSAGFDIEEVVAEYGMLRRAIFDLAEADGVSLPVASMHVLAVTIDTAVANAVRAYATEQAAEIRKRRQEYLSFVAHDLRTPLNAIVLAGHALQSELPEASTTPHAQRLLQAIQRNAQEIHRLVAKILEDNRPLGEGDQFEGRSIDLWPFVQSVLRDLAPAAEAAGVTLTNDVPDVAVHADADRLHRILVNLLSNAIDYTPGGEVTVGARQMEDGVEIRVSDNGAGIPPERLDRVFDKFEADPHRDRTGLGLAIVKKFVEAHGGRVSVESEPGSGSTFRFTLPNARAPGT